MFVCLVFFILGYFDVGIVYCVGVFLLMLCYRCFVYMIEFDCNISIDSCVWVLVVMSFVFYCLFILILIL